MGISKEILVQIMQSTLTTIFFFALHTVTANAQVLSTTLCNAQNDSAQWVLSNFIEVTGGYSLWDSTWSLSTAQVSSSRNGGFTGVSEEESSLRKKALTKDGEAMIRDFTVKNGISTTYIHCLRNDHYTLHILKSDDTTHLFPVADLELLQDIKEAYGLLGIQQHLLHPAVDSLTIAFGGRYREGHQEWWLISLQDDSGTSTWYVNTKSFLVERIESDNGRISKREEYAAFDGRLIPTIRRTYSNGKIIHEVRIKSASFNVPLPDCPFSHTGED